MERSNLIKCVLNEEQLNVMSVFNVIINMVSFTDFCFAVNALEVFYVHIYIVVSLIILF